MPKAHRFNHDAVCIDCGFDAAEHHHLNRALDPSERAPAPVCRPSRYRVLRKDLVRCKCGWYFESRNHRRCELIHLMDHALEEAGA